MSKILYVEDNDDNIYVIERRLARKGYEIIVARNGEQGIEIAENERPELILMDLGLPVLDGWEATRRLKSSSKTKNIPVIALSSHAMDSDRSSALAAGCDDFETKPIELPRLLSKIEALLAKETPS